jgi:hypothetical protein
MADWFVSLAAYTAIPVFAIGATYAVGNIVRPIAPVAKARWAFRCTVGGIAGPAEPTWPTGNNAPISTGEVTFVNVTGQSTYGWSAVAGDMPTLLGAVGAQRFFGGDRMLVSSDHDESQTTSTSYGSGGASSVSAFATAQVLSVNRAGAVPPGPADLLPGAIARISGGSTNSLQFWAGFNVYHYGMTYINATGWIAAFIFDLYKTHYFERCQLWINNATAGLRLQNAQPNTVVLDNSSVRFGNAGQSFQCGYDLNLTWLNTPIPLGGGTIPTALFNATSGIYVLRGVDLSLLTTALVATGGASNVTGPKVLLDSCRIAPNVVRLSNASGGSAITTHDLVELINCYDGSNYISERWMAQGAVTTEFAVTLTNGARDNVGGYSHKMVSNANSDFAEPLSGFWLDLNSVAIGTPVNAVVEIISSVTLNNNDIWLLLEFQGTVGSSLATFRKSLPANVLTGATPVLSSTAAWNSMPASPIRQQLLINFTPQVAGRVRAQVCLARPSTTVWYNPQVTIS